jgi:4'-phosphopantetheinyl transferase
MNLNPDEVHIWSAFIDERYNKLLTNLYLSEKEKRRAEKFSYDIDSFIFTVRHNLLPIILGHYLNCHPAEIKFKNNRFQKPHIDYPITSIQFNISASSNRFVAAFTQHHTIGIDVEQIRQIKTINQLIADYFTINEANWVYNHPESMQERAFFSIWTKKEALVKAIGQGLSIRPNMFDVLSDNLISFCNEKWELLPLNIFENCFATIAINSPTVKLCYYNTDELI